MCGRLRMPAPTNKAGVPGDRQTPLADRSLEPLPTNFSKKALIGLGAVILVAALAFLLMRGGGGFTPAAWEDVVIGDFSGVVEEAIGDPHDRNTSGIRGEQVWYWVHDDHVYTLTVAGGVVTRKNPDPLTCEVSEIDC